MMPMEALDSIFMVYPKGTKSIEQIVAAPGTFPCPDFPLPHTGKSMGVKGRLNSTDLWIGMGSLSQASDVFDLVF